MFKIPLYCMTGIWHFLASSFLLFLFSKVCDIHELYEYKGIFYFVNSTIFCNFAPKIKYIS